MDLISQVTLLGGVCDRSTIVRLRSAAEVDAALREGVLERIGRGKYAVSTTLLARRMAGLLGGVVSHRSAATHWGWAQKSPPDRTELSFPREFVLRRDLRRAVIPHWVELADSDVDGLVTSPRRTLVDCMRNLPLDEALAIVNSAIRADDVTHAELVTLADATRGRGRARIRAVAREATGACTNPFESVLHAQALLVPGLRVTPQLPVSVPGRSRPLHPDLADPILKLALESEGFEWHGRPHQLTRDCRRYNAMTLLGWLVIRFSWQLVMHQPAYVHQVLVEAVASRERHANVA